jgi:hypothetical protein
LAAQDGAIYLDLGDPDWRQVEISDATWMVLDRPRLRFRRPRGLAPLPVPERGGSLDELRPFLNISDEHWPLVLGFLVAMVRPGRPFPVLNLLGAQGSAKSTTAKVLRKLVDPNAVELRAEPKVERDLAIGASNSHVLALDNLSNLRPGLSDAICRIATGGGFSTRQLYSDDGEALFNFIRPVLLTGIEDLAVRGDLLDRSLLIYLPTISEEKRQDEEQFWRDFEQARPRLLGALLDAVSTALAQLPDVKLDRLPRMADFAKWVIAAAPALRLDPDDWLATYEENRQQGHDIAVEASVVAAAVRRFMGDGDDEETKRGPWSGTATALLETLNLSASDQTRRARAWPKSASALSGALGRLQPDLASLGLAVDIGRTARRRGIRLEWVGESPSSPSSPSPTPDDQGKHDDGPDDDDDGVDQDDRPSPSSSETRSGQRKRRRHDADDDDDGVSPARSKSCKTCQQPTSPDVLDATGGLCVDCRRKRRNPNAAKTRRGRGR